MYYYYQHVTPAVKTMQTQINTINITWNSWNSWILGQITCQFWDFRWNQWRNEN